MKKRDTAAVVVRAAMRYWKANRPLCMTLADHIKNPSVNMMDGYPHMALGKACARHAASKAKARKGGGR